MTDYKQLAIRYLGYNKKRTFLTILGVALSTMILFVLFNTVISFYVTERGNCREAVKYEVIFWCESQVMAEQLAEEKYIETWERKSMIKPESGELFEEALCVCFKHPFQMNVFLERATQKYGVTYTYTELGEYYFVTGEDNWLLILALTVLLFAYIFAILGVAVIRNSIQLISLEQIKDYGVLRCMGCTRKQLKRVVYLMGFVLEMSGATLGIGLGFGVYLVIAHKAKLEIGFHVIGVLFILLAFLGDLYFVMQENCKFVNKLTPVAAVRGEFKMNQKELKARGKGLAGKVFGIEGEYASKCLKRNPARMWKSVGSMSMGIAMVVVAVSVFGTITDYVTQDSRRYGRYQLVNAWTREPGFGLLYYEDLFLSQEQKERIKESEQVVDEKKVYETMIFTALPLFMVEHETEEYKTETFCGGRRDREAKSYLDGTLNEEGKKRYQLSFAGNNLLGYDKEDYERLKPYLVDGTLDLSGEGIVLINGMYTMKEDTEMLNTVWAEYMVTDLCVGDRIEFVDMKAFDALVKERICGMELKKESENYYRLHNDILYECYNELISQGKTKTYTIEGIVSRDVNRYSVKSGASFVLPMEHYLEETGYTKEMYSGTMYHIDGYGLDEILEDIYYSDNAEYMDKEYLSELEVLGTIWDFIVGATLFVLFMVVISMLNIANTTASDLYLRRKEFAQLRVLGMSKKRLIFTVMLEGVFTAFLADALGVALGYGIIKMIVDFINKGYYVPLFFSWGACVFMLIVNTGIICLTIYLPIRSLHIDMAEALQAAGE